MEITLKPTNLIELDPSFIIMVLAWVKSSTLNNIFLLDILLKELDISQNVVKFITEGLIET
jgi:hypothetical protein